MPDNHIFYFPILFHFSPNSSYVFPILIDNDGKMFLLNFCNICHPIFREIWRENTGFQISSVSFCSKSFSCFAMFFLALEVIQDIRWVCKTHVSLLSTHEPEDICLSSGISTHKATIPEFPDVSFLNVNLSYV